MQNDDDLFADLKSFKFDEINNISHLEQKELFRKEALIRNSTIIECPHCGVKGNEPNMLRWHFDNCDTILKKCQQCGETIPRQGIKPFLYNQKKYCNRKCYMQSKIGIPPIIMTDEIKKKISAISLTQSKERSDRIKISKPWKYRK